MKKVIEAITILFNYTKDEYPFTHKGNKFIVLINPKYVAPVDVFKLSDLGFKADYDSLCFYYYYE